MKPSIKYFLIAVVAWFIVDFTTTSAIADLGYYTIYMPGILLFYFGYPLIFSLLIYKFKLKEKGLFISMLIGIFVVEIVFTGNALFLQFPLVILLIPISLAYYSMVTFVPYWIVKNKIKKYKGWFKATLIIYIIGSVLNLITQLKVG